MRCQLLFCPAPPRFTQPGLGRRRGAQHELKSLGPTLEPFAYPWTANRLFRQYFSYFNTTLFNLFKYEICTHHRSDSYVSYTKPYVPCALNAKDSKLVALEEGLQCGFIFLKNPLGGPDVY